MPANLDEIVRDFDAAWIAGEKPSASRFLELAEEGQGKELLERLLAIDIGRRHRRGESVDAFDYTSLGSDALEAARPSLLELDSRIQVGV